LTAFGSNNTLTNELCNGNTRDPDASSDLDSDEDLSLDEELDSDSEQWTKTVPTVFHWEHGGENVFLAGSFSDWKARIPMNSRY
jgi:5'-AMP-activated protein kinase regulatory beta subunit